MLHKSLSLTLVLTAASLTSCEGTNDLNGTSTGNGLVMALVSSGSSQSQALSSSDSQGTAFGLSSAQAFVRDIELDLLEGVGCDAAGVLEPPLSCEVDEDDGDAKIKIEGPLVFDLVNRTSTPSLDNINLPALTYDRIDVRFKKAEDSQNLVPTDDPLAGNTLIASGNFTYEGSPRTFELALGFSEDARFEKSGGITLVANAATTILLELNVDAWFASLPITECIEDGDLSFNGDNLVISDSGDDCSDIENTLKDAIKDSGQLNIESPDSDDDTSIESSDDDTDTDTDTDSDS